MIHNGLQVLPLNPHPKCVQRCKDFYVCETFRASSRKIMRALRVGTLSLDGKYYFIYMGKRV